MKILNTLAKLAILAEVFFLMPQVLAATVTNNGVVWAFSVSEDGATLSSVRPASGDLVIPSALNGHAVTAIESLAFSYCTNLTSVTIPDSVLEIGERAFFECKGLTSVTMGNSVANIGSYAFYGCRGLKAVHISDLAAWCGISCENKEASPLFYAKRLYLNGNEVAGDLALPDGLTSLGNYAFVKCSKLTSVTIPESVAKVGDGVFCDCIGLKTVAIPNSVSDIGSQAFYECTGLSSITIPNSVTNIGSYAFAGCSGLTNVNLPDSVTSVGDWLFYNCNGLTNMTIPTSVRSIGEYAFAHCRGLTSVTIPDSVTEIGDYAFYYCFELTNVTIPDNVTNIGAYAFSTCLRLNTLVIPNSMTDIGDKAVSGSGLTTLCVPLEWKETAMLANVDVPSGCKVVYGDLNWMVTFDANGGSCATTSMQVKHDNAIGALPVPSRLGWIFQGWFTAKNGGSKIVTTTKIIANRAFYAQWKATTYKVAFNANGGALPKGKTMEPQIITYGKGTRLRKNIFIRKGWVFIGWSKAKNGPIAYENTAAVQNLTANGGIVTLYAKWAKPHYMVAFNANGGTGKMAVQTLTYGKAAKLRANAFTRKGCIFLGWSTSKTGEVVYSNRQAVKDLRSDGKRATLYAKWARKNNNVVFNANGGTVSPGSKTVKYNARLGTLPKPKRANYNFLGWFTAKSGGLKISSTTRITSSRTFYAHWTPKPLANLRFYRRSGWPAAAYVTAVTNGTSARNSFRKGTKVYLNFAYGNDGNAVAKPHRISVMLLNSTGTIIETWDYRIDEALGLKEYEYFSDFFESPMPIGSYTALIALDSENAIKELNENDNAGMVTFTIVAAKDNATALKGVKVAATTESAPTTEEMTAAWVGVTSSDGRNAEFVFDGDENTAWSPDTAGGSWVVLSFAGPREIEDVEVIGENLPEGTRFLLSEDADNWQEGVPGTAQYVWVVFPAGDAAPVVQEIRVLEKK